jgi:hypothetical protein
VIVLGVHHLSITVISLVLVQAIQEFAHFTLKDVEYVDVVAISILVSDEPEVILTGSEK